MSRSGQNTSSAVMQQRHEAHDSLDDFATPPWAARALCEHVLSRVRGDETAQLRREQARILLGTQSVYEPAVNRGYLAAGLADYFGAVFGSDVATYPDFCPRWTDRVHDTPGCRHKAAPTDFLAMLAPGEDRSPADWIITNPPFRLGEAFALRCAELAPARGFALFVRSAFLEGAGRGGQDGRYHMFARMKPAVIAQFSERVILSRGAPRDPSRKYWDPGADGGAGKWRRPSTATAYCWIVWTRQKGVTADGPAFEAAYSAPQTEFVWIPPCRRELERAGDYPEVEG